MDESGSAIRIVIVDDHGLIRECIHLLFAAEKGFQIVGEAANGIDAVDVISEMKPDIALLDISIPGMTGLELIPVIRQKSPETKVLMLTGKDQDETIVKALKAGARGYLSKDTTTEGLIKSIKVVHRGDMWIERKLVSRIFQTNGSNDLNSAVQRKKDVEDLTPREQDILRLLAKGITNKEIAKDLFISEQTVKSHLNRIFRKLKVSRRLEAILYAIKKGIS